MRKLNIAAVQFPLTPVTSFNDFAAKVNECAAKTKGSDFVVYGEFFTTELVRTLGDSNVLKISDIKEIARYTGDYLDLFFNIAERQKQYIIAGSHIIQENGKFYNTCHIFQPNGEIFRHKKTHLFPVEFEWGISEGDALEILETEKAKIGISICYEAQIPECARILTMKGAEIIFCPSITFTESGFWRVRHSCEARCIENQILMVHCSTIGDAQVLNLRGWGRASILSPCDIPWSANGIIAEGVTNQGLQLVKAEVDVDQIYTTREKGAATPHKDRIRRAKLYEELYRKK